MRHSKDSDKINTALGIVLVVGGIIITGVGATAISFDLPIAAQMIGEIASTDLMILSGSIIAPVGGFIAGAGKYPWMLMSAALWAIAFNVMVSKLGTAISYTSWIDQATTWFALNFCLTAATLGISNYLTQSDIQIVKTNKVANSTIQPNNQANTSSSSSARQENNVMDETIVEKETKEIDGGFSVMEIAGCSFTIGTIAVASATGLSKFTETFVRETSIGIIVNTALTVLLAEVLVACAAAKDHYIGVRIIEF
ncbi:MAG: hypothetical protein JSS50_04375 [Proteobacteria bacterium]|nr:hypothetical protein [Pseudomonadota bacterium]